MISRQILTLCGTGLILSVMGCGSGNSVTPDLGQQTPNQVVTPRKYSVTLSFVDAATGNLLAPNVAIALHGSLANRIQDALGTPLTKLTASNSITSFYTDSAGTLEVVATADGYFAGGAIVPVRDSLNIGIIRMVSLTKPPQGVVLGISSGNQTATNGVLNDSVSLNVATLGGTATAMLPKSVNLSAADGTKLTGAVTMTLLTYNVDSASVLASIPGGNLVFTTNRGAIPMQFLAAVGISVKDASNRVATSVTPSYTLSLPVPPTIVNPLTGAAFAVGDSVDIVSLATGASEWKLEGGAKVTSLGGLPFVTFTPNHLSYWGIRVRQTAPGEAVCAPLVFKLPSSAGANVSISLFRNGYYSSTNSLGSKIARTNLLPSQTLALNANWGSSSHFSSIAAHACGDTVTLNLNPLTSDVSQTFELLGTCTQGGLPEGLKGNAISIFQNGAFVTSVRTDSLGTAVVSGLAPTGLYSYSVQIDGTSKPISNGFVAGGNPIAITATVDCHVLTGASGN